MQYYERLRQIREDRDFTQQGIASFLGITRQQYQLYESGSRTIKINLLSKLCLFYGVSADYILGLPKNLHWPR